LKTGHPVFTLGNKVLFMSDQNQHLEHLRDIRQLMEKSSRFISLSGWSGVAAGLCALASAWVVRGRMERYHSSHNIDDQLAGYYFRDGYLSLERELIIIALITFALAAGLAFLFTYLRSRKTGVPIWGHVARKVMFNVAIPMVVGGVVILRMMQLGLYGMVAPACLLFYGLGLINASKYTYSEIRWLGFGQLILGLLNLWNIGYGLLFWAIGFGVLHIIYGLLMWWRYERTEERTEMNQ